MRQRYFLIDGLRTVCALIVVLFHYPVVFFNPAMEAAGLGVGTARKLGLYPGLDFIDTYGSWAVMLFWSISGFIFAHIYHARRDISGRSFFMNRFSRLYPLHLATLLHVGILHLMAMAAFGQQIETGSNTWLTFGQNLLLVSAWGDANVHSFNTPIWSVSVEIAIYIVFFFVLRAVGVGLLSMAAMVLVCLGLMAVTGNMIPVCGVYFFLSAAAWCALQRLEHVGPGWRWSLTAGLTALALGPAALAAVTGKVLPLTVILAPPCAMGLVLLALVEHRLAKAPAFLESFGDITYSTYLLHIPMQQSFLLAVMAGLIAPEVLIHPLAPWIYLGLVIVAGHLCFRHFERPMQNWLRGLGRTMHLPEA